MPLEWISQILEWVDSLPFPFNMIVRFVVFGGVSAYVMWRAVKTVPQDQRAMKLRLGRVIRYKRGPLKGQAKEYVPGRIYLLIPEVDKFEFVKVLDRTVEFPEKPIDVDNYRQLKVEGNANYAAANIEHLRYRVEDVEPWLRGTTQKILRECVQEEWRGWNSHAYQARVAHSFAKRIDAEVSYVGVKLQALHITNLAESDGMALARAVGEAANGTQELPPFDNDYPDDPDSRVVGHLQIRVVDEQPEKWELTESDAAIEAFNRRKSWFGWLRRQRRSETGERL